MVTSAPIFGSFAPKVLPPTAKILVYKFASVWPILVGAAPLAPVEFTPAPEEPLGKMDKGYFWVTPLRGSLGEKVGHFTSFLAPKVTKMRIFIMIKALKAP